MPVGEDRKPGGGGALFVGGVMYPRKVSIYGATLPPVKWRWPTSNGREVCKGGGRDMHFRGGWAGGWSAGVKFTTYLLHYR